MMLFIDGDTCLLDLQRHFIADVLQRIHRRHGEITFLRADFVTEVWKFLATAVPMTFAAVDDIRRGVPAVRKADIIENEEFCLRSEKCSVSDAGALEVSFGFFGDAARVAIVRLARDRIDDGANQTQRRFSVEDVDPRWVRVGNDEHVRGVDAFPAANTGAVEPESIGKDVVAVVTERSGEMLVIPDPNTA